MRLSVLVMLAGCDGVFNLDRIPVRDAHADDGQPDARPGCTVDRFADGVTGVLGRWNRTAESAGVEITIDADQVVARVAADATGIAELDSLRKFDRRDGDARGPRSTRAAERRDLLRPRPRRPTSTHSTSPTTRC